MLRPYCFQGLESLTIDVVQAAGNMEDWELKQT
jgi:hypothetical protein